MRQEWECGKGKKLDNQTPIWWPIWLGSIMCYWLILIVNHHHLCHLSECGILCHDWSKGWWHNDRHHPYNVCHWHHGHHHHHHLLDVIGCGILCDCVSRRWWCYSAEQMVTARAQRNLSNGRCNGQNMNKQANKILGQIWWNLIV